MGEDQTIDYAMNGPVGMCAQALFNAIPREYEKLVERTPPSFWQRLFAVLPFGFTKQHSSDEEVKPKVIPSDIPKTITSRIDLLLSAPGEGSDHAVSVWMQQLAWLHYVDPNWTEERLLPMLSFSHLSAEPAWNGYLSSQRVPPGPIAVLLKPQLLGLIEWIEQQSWGRSYTKIAAKWLGYLFVFEEGESHGLTKKEMRNSLRSMSDETRNDFIFWLGQVGQGNDDGWTRLVVPFLHDVWPRERIYRTTSSTNSWIGLLDDAGENFPDVYAAVKQFLVPVETDSHPFYRFTGELDDATLLTAQFPDTTLDLVNTVTPTALVRPPYELPKILAIIAEVAPGLTSDHRYLRLIDLVERS